MHPFLFLTYWQHIFTAVAGLSYWALGYAFAFGDGTGFIGGSGFFGTFPEADLSKWFFQMVFAATAATIVSGGVAERCEFVAYLTYSIVLTGEFCVSFYYYHMYVSTIILFESIYQQQ